MLQIMFERIAKLLSAGFAPSLEEQGPGEGVRLAAAVLMVEVMGADFEVSEVERGSIRDLLREHFSLDGAEVSELVGRAERRAREVTSLRGCTRRLVDRLDEKERERLLELLWSLAYADGRIDKYEEHLLRRIADLLYLPHPAFIRAKLRAAGSA